MHLVVLVNSQKIFVRMEGRILGSTCKVVRPQLWVCVCLCFGCLGCWSTGRRTAAPQYLDGGLVSSHYFPDVRHPAMEAGALRPSFWRTGKMKSLDRFMAPDITRPDGHLRPAAPSTCPARVLGCAVYSGCGWLVPLV
jgi:hypothetical protein